MLTDLLITKPPFGEYLDIFSKRKFYSQSLTRYHASNDDVMKLLEPVPTELSSNTNLNALRKSLFDANLEDDLIMILKRKYFPHLCYNRNKISANEFLNELDLPVEVARVIRTAWEANGNTGKEMTLENIS